MSVPMMAALAVALLGEVYLRKHAQWSMANILRQRPEVIKERAFWTYLVSVVVGIALALAIAPPLARLGGGDLLVLAVLLGLNRAVGLGIGTLLVFLFWQPDIGVVLWFSVPLIVLAGVAIAMSARTKLLIDGLDGWEGPTPWGLLLVLMAGAAAGWTIWSWAGWASVTVLACLLVWAHGPPPAAARTSK